MPIYDFKCKGCGKVSELRVRSVESREVSFPDRAGSMSHGVYKSEIPRYGNIICKVAALSD